MKLSHYRLAQSLPETSYTRSRKNAIHDTGEPP